jgi:hypothetical protein
MCAKKPYYEEPIGLCSAWSWNKGSKTCWMKTRNSTHPSHNGDTSGVVTSRGSRSINTSCGALPRAERIACPDVTSGGSLNAAQCAALGCCFDASDDAAGTAAPQCFYYGEAKGTPPPCSLNGARSATGGCACDSGWEGVNCERLRLKPANLSDGFNSWSTTEAGTSSWGATQLKGEDGVYHTWVDEMTKGCGINGYENNMHIVHYTSKQRLGGWTRQAPVSNVTSICAHALRDPASLKYLLFHTGCGDIMNPNSHGYPLPTRTRITNCANGSTPDCTGNPNTTKCKYAPLPPAMPPAPPGPHLPPICGEASNLMSIFVSDSPDGVSLTVHSSHWTIKLDRLPADNLTIVSLLAL